MVHKEKRLILKCPKCGDVAPYGGYPSDPQMSSVLCMKCGYVGVGMAFKRMKGVPRRK